MQYIQRHDIITRNVPLKRRNNEVKKINIFIFDYILPSLLVLIIATIFTITNFKNINWFIVPVIACGILTMPDVIRWFRGYYDPFDPKCLIGMVVFYGWFIAPLLHVYFNYYGEFFVSLTDFQKWAGIVAWVNACGILFYKLSQHWAFNYCQGVRKKWGLISSHLLPVLASLGLVALISQIYFNRGVRSSIESVGNVYLGSKGWGYLLVLGDPLPILLVIGLITWTIKPVQRTRSMIAVIIILSLASILQFLWVGLRGSRSATVLGVFWATGLVNHYWRRLKPAFLVSGLVLLIIFLFLYGIFFKTIHPKSLSEIKSMADIQRQSQKSGRTIESTLLFDLARVHVQAEIAKGLVEQKNHKLSYGRTYLDALSRIIPGSVWNIILKDTSFKDNWNKGKAYVDLTEGEGKYHPKHHRSSQVYGLSGEAMLNFGFYGAPFVWLIFGLVVGFARRKRDSLPVDDTRWALMPLLSYILMMSTISDMDNIVFMLIKGASLIYLAIFLWSRHIKINPNKQ